LPLISLDIAWIGWWKFLRLSTECDKKMCWITLAKYLWTFIVKRVLIKCYKIKVFTSKKWKKFCLSIALLSVQLQYKIFLS
jgi:hypothetical protein